MEVSLLVKKLENLSKQGSSELKLLFHVLFYFYPYFFAEGHQNYARYGLFYLRAMQKMPVSVMKNFLNGDHVMRHMPGFWNGIWSDVWIETTFMSFGHDLKGIIGTTLKPETEDMGIKLTY